MSESTAQDKPSSPEKQVLVDAWYLRALEDSAVLYEAIKPVTVRYSETLNATRTAYELEKRGRQITDELYELDRRKWQLSEADLKRQINKLKWAGRLRGIGYAVAGAGLLVLIAK